MIVLARSSASLVDMKSKKTALSGKKIVHSIWYLSISGLRILAEHNIHSYGMSIPLNCVYMINCDVERANVKCH